MADNLENSAIENTLIERLINAVASHECLWNKKSGDIKNKPMKENAWENVSTVVGVPVKECISKWQYMRQKYAKYLKDEAVRTRSGASGGAAKHVPHMELLGFLRNQVGYRRSWTTTSPVEDIGTVADSGISTPIPVGNARRTNYFSHMDAQEEVDLTNNYTDVEFLDESECSTPVVQVEREEFLQKSFKKKTYNKSANLEVMNINSAVESVKKVGELIQKRIEAQPSISGAQSQDAAFANHLVALLADVPRKEKLMFMRDTINSLISIKMGLEDD